MTHDLQNTIAAARLSLSWPARLLVDLALVALVLGTVSVSMALGVLP